MYWSCFSSLSLSSPSPEASSSLTAISLFSREKGSRHMLGSSLVVVALPGYSFSPLTAYQIHVYLHMYIGSDASKAGPI